MSEREALAWAAGFFDGEGTIFCTGARPGHSVVRLAVGQKDRSVLDRFRAAVGCGKVYGPHASARGAAMFSFTTSRLEHVQAVVAKLWFGLSPIKRARIIAAMTRAARARDTRRDALTRCAHGHPFTPDNTRVYTWNGKRSRFCRQCGRDRYARTRDHGAARRHAG